MSISSEQHAPPLRSTQIIAYLPVHFGRLHPRSGITALRDPGDPIELARLLAAQGAARLFVDFHDDLRAIDRVLRTLKAITSAVTCPVIASIADGALSTPDELTRFLDAGIQRYAFNTSAVRHPEWIDAFSARHGPGCALGMIRARRVTSDWWEPLIEHGAEPTGLDAISWAHELSERGVCEFLVHSVDRARHGWGYDLELTRTVADTIRAPVIASGGAALPQDLVAGLVQGHASAVIVDDMIHTGRCSLETVGAYLGAWTQDLEPAPLATR